MRPLVISKQLFQFSLFLFLLLFTNQLFAQENSILIEAEMNDGAIILGVLIEDNETHLILDSKAIGRVAIDKLKIRLYKRVKENLIAKENGWVENPNATRNIFSPTGYGLKKNEGYYQNFMLGLNQVSYGVTDNLTIGLTLEAFTTFAAINGFIDSPAFAITPKYSIPVKKDFYNIGVGAMIINLPNTDRLFDWNLFYVVNTIGSKDRNVSLGVAYGLRDGSLASRPTFTLSGAYRLSPKVSLITENWFISNIDSFQAFNLFGVRITGKKLSWDIALLGTRSNRRRNRSYYLFPLPIGGVTVPFGRGWTK